MYIRSHNKSGTLAQAVTEVMGLRALRRRIGLRGPAGNQATQKTGAIPIGNTGRADAGISAPEERTHYTEQEYRRYYR
jgi:hypothetical protein